MTTVPFASTVVTPLCVEIALMRKMLNAPIVSRYAPSRVSLNRSRITVSCTNVSNAVWSAPAAKPSPMMTRLYFSAFGPLRSSSVTVCARASVKVAVSATITPSTTATTTPPTVRLSDAKRSMVGFMVASPVRCCG